MALLDKIKEQLGEAPQPTGGGQTQTVRELLRAKTGKAAVPGAAPRQSAIQEKMAERQTQVGMEQLGLRGRIQEEQLGQQETDITQREQQQQVQAAEQFKDIQAQMQRQTTQLLHQFESGQKSLQSNKDIADLEQLGFQTRLQNKEYIQQLQQEGQRARLDNMLEFKKQMARNILKDQQELFVNQAAFERITAANDMEFAEELSQMDLGYAMQVADNAMKAAGQRAVFTGAATAISGGLQAAAASGVFNSNSAASPGASGAANPTPVEQQRQMSLESEHLSASEFDAFMRGRK